VKEWSTLEGWNGRTLNQCEAKGIFVGALGVLAVHYGYQHTDRATLKRITIPRMTEPKARKYQRPEFLMTVVEQDIYEHWLYRKTKSLVARDKRNGAQVSALVYRDAIHQAVLTSKGLDVYTGEKLDWTLISQYDNDKSKQFGRNYKHKFALLPTVDHIDDPRLGSANFTICAWRTNDAKHDLALEEFIALCEKVLAHMAGKCKKI